MKSIERQSIAAWLETWRVEDAEPFRYSDTVAASDYVYPEWPAADRSRGLDPSGIPDKQEP